MNAERNQPSPYPTGSIPLLLTFALLFAAFDASATLDRVEERMAFDVFLEDRPIGNHEFVLQSDEDITTVSINARFKIKLLFITALNYRHNNVETWRDNCLQSIAATTVVNGDTFNVTGRQQSETFTLIDDPSEDQPKIQAQRAGSDRPSIDSDIRCARSFAYWDRSLLEAQALLNSQTGEFTATRLEPLGSGTLSIGGNPVPVQRYRLVGEDIDITLAYTKTAAGDEQWVGLSSKVRGGRTLSYVRSADSLHNTE